MRLLLTACLLLLAPLAQAYSAQSLARDPVAHHDGGTCVVRGAVYSRATGPVAHARLTLVEVGGTARVEVITDAQGFYEATIRVKPGAVLRERLAPEVRRAAVRVGSRLPAVYEPQFECSQGRVSVGTPRMAAAPAPFPFGIGAFPIALASL